MVQVPTGVAVTGIFDVKNTTLAEICGQYKYWNPSLTAYRQVSSHRDKGGLGTQKGIGGMNKSISLGSQSKANNDSGSWERIGCKSKSHDLTRKSREKRE